MAVLNDSDHNYQRWTNTLEHLRQESALLKYRLSEMVDSDEENLFLQKAEYFQNELLLRDEMLKKLIKEVQDFKDFSYNKKNPPKKIVHLNEKLETGISTFENQFRHLTEEFNQLMPQHY